MLIQMIQRIPERLIHPLDSSDQHRALHAADNQVRQLARVHILPDRPRLFSVFDNLAEHSLPAVQRLAYPLPQHRIPIRRIHRRIQQRTPARKPRPRYKVHNVLLQPIHMVWNRIEMPEPVLAGRSPREVECFRQLRFNYISVLMTVDVKLNGFTVVQESRHAFQP